MTNGLVIQVDACATSIAPALNAPVAMKVVASAHDPTSINVSSAVTERCVEHVSIEAYVIETLLSSIYF